MLKATKAKFPKTIKVEGVSGITATIYRQERTKADTSDKLRTYVSYLLSYSLLGKRKVESFADLIEAEGAGETAIKKIANGEQRILQLNNRDQLCYQRAQESLSGLNVALDTACAQYAEALRALNGKGTLLEACQDFARRHGSITTKLMVPDAVKKMIEQEESQQDGKRKQAWVKLLKAHLQGEGKFAQSFNCEVAASALEEYETLLTRAKGDHAKELDSPPGGIRYPMDAAFLTKEFVLQATEIFAHARALAAGDEALTRRVERAELPVLYVKCVRGPEFVGAGYALAVGEFERIARGENIRFLEEGGPDFESKLAGYKNRISPPNGAK